MGIPTLFIIIGIIIIMWLFLKKKDKKLRKRLNLGREIKKDFNNMYSNFGSKIKKKLRSGFIEIGYSIGQFPILWDKYTTERLNPRINKKLKMAILGKTKEGEHIEEMLCIKYTKKPLAKAKALFGVFGHYMIVPYDKIVLESKEITISPTLQGFDFFDIMLFSKVGKHYVENIAFKLSRQEELTELADFVPKQNYLEMTTASQTVKAREQAQIEKEKYKGQIENVGG